MSIRYFLQNQRSSMRYRYYSTENASTPKNKSMHAEWYSTLLPAMIPVFLLGSAVYLGLQLTQLKLSHERYMEDAKMQVQALEAKIDSLQAERAQQNPQNTSAQEATVPQTGSRSWWW